VIVPSVPMGIASTVLRVPSLELPAMFTVV
jgi:hypothetical protein